MRRAELLTTCQTSAVLSQRSLQPVVEALGTYAVKPAAAFSCAKCDVRLSLRSRLQGDCVVQTSSKELECKSMWCLRHLPIGSLPGPAQLQLTIKSDKASLESLWSPWVQSGINRGKRACLWVLAGVKILMGPSSESSSGVHSSMATGTTWPSFLCKHCAAVSDLPCACCGHDTPTCAPVACHRLQRLNHQGPCCSVCCCEDACGHVLMLQGNYGLRMIMRSRHAVA